MINITKIFQRALIALYALALPTLVQAAHHEASGGLRMAPARRLVADVDHTGSSLGIEMAELIAIGHGARSVACCRGSLKRRQKGGERVGAPRIMAMPPW